jgi:PAS domain S-box-containing protein
VYRALAGSNGDQQVAVKVLEPSLNSDRGFLQRFEQDVGLVSSLGHPHILPVYAHATAEGVTYVAMAYAAGGTLRARQEAGPLAPARAWQVLAALAGALHRAHEAGAVHRDVKPANVLFDAGGTPMLADFGLARTHLGFATGTPAYMAPEQAMGGEPDRLADVYALGVIAFELLTGTRLREEGGPIPQLLRAVVEAHIPVASEIAPSLPAAIDEVLGRALAADPAARYATTIDLVGDLGEVLGLGSLPAPALNGREPSPGADFEHDVAQLMTVIDNSLSAAIAIDEKSFIVGWNGVAEKTFGWAHDEIVGRLLSTTLIPPRYQEAHERGFQRYLDSGEGPVIGSVIEITAIHRGGAEFPIELSIAPAVQSGTRARVLAFARDIGPEKRALQMRAAQETVLASLAGGDSLADAAPRILEAIGTALEWPLVAAWVVEEEALRCIHVWKAEGVDAPQFEEATKAARFARGEGVCGRAWETGEALWVSDVLHDAAEPRSLVALRAGLRAAVAVPVHAAGEVRAVLELFAPDVRAEDEDLLLRLYDFGRRIGRRLPAKS